MERLDEEFIERSGTWSLTELRKQFTKDQQRTHNKRKLTDSEVTVQFIQIISTKKVSDFCQVNSGISSAGIFFGVVNNVIFFYFIIKQIRDM